jgi:hypothetical protein
MGERYTSRTGVVIRGSHRYRRAAMRGHYRLAVFVVSLCFLGACKKSSDSGDGVAEAAKRPKAHQLRIASYEPAVIDPAKHRDGAGLRLWKISLRAF